METEPEDLLEVLQDVDAFSLGGSFRSIEDLAVPALAIAAPEVGVPLQLLEKLLKGAPSSEIRQLVPPPARSTFSGFWDWFVHNAGFTEEEDYAGLYPAAALAWYFLAPPLETAWIIEKQIVGTLEQLHSFLGGAGSALQHGEQALGGNLKSLGSELLSAAETAVSETFGFL